LTAAVGDGIVGPGSRGKCSDGAGGAVHERVVSCLLPLAAVAAARAVIALVGVAAVACESPTSPARGWPLTPPPVFSEWWQNVEQCSGVTGDVGRINWYVVPCQEGETGFRCEVTPDGLCAGQWRAPHLIELAGPNRIFPHGYVDDEWTVKHEMLHDLLGTVDHPKAFGDCHLALR
jgi:hypothetical protein